LVASGNDRFDMFAADSRGDHLVSDQSHRKSCDRLSCSTSRSC
jgi:hypothetical protein